MKIPAIACQTFLRCKEHPILGRLWRNVVQTLSLITDSISRAQYIHRLIDEKLAPVVSNPTVEKYVSCKKGCSACCHTQVSVTADEAHLLAILLKQQKNVDFNKLEMQARSQDDAASWYRLSFDQRSCIFLKSDQTCSVYENRPSVCRTNYAFNPSILCDTRDGVEHPLRLLKTEEADMVIAASFVEAKDAGALPFMVWKALLQLNQARKKSYAKEKLK